MNKYLKGIKNSDRTILNEIYVQFFPPLKSFILQNQGNQSDAEDVFQEALIATFRRLQKEDFKLSATFGTYIFTVGKFIWFKKLKKNKSIISVEEIRLKDVNRVEIELEGEDKYALFEKVIAQLGKDCQKVLNYFFDRKSFKEIAQLMNYTGEEYARRKKYLCTKELTKKIKSDSAFTELYTS